MIARSQTVSLETLAHRFFEVLTHLTLTLPRSRRRGGTQLKETEFFTLALLQQHDTLSVGDLHRILHVLPAQMSRILRSLEMRQPPLIVCTINPQDKRKVDVELTEAGEQELQRYESQRVGILAEMLSQIGAEDLNHLSHILDTIEDATTHATEQAREENAAPV